VQLKYSPSDDGPAGPSGSTTAVAGLVGVGIEMLCPGEPYTPLRVVQPNISLAQPAVMIPAASMFSRCENPDTRYSANCRRTLPPSM